MTSNTHTRHFQKKKKQNMQDGLLSGEKKKEGCCPNYNFATWSRVLAFLSAIALTVIGVVTISRLESALFAFFATFMICITEMPFCMQCCFSEETTQKMKCKSLSFADPPSFFLTFLRTREKQVSKLARRIQRDVCSEEYFILDFV